MKKNFKVITINGVRGIFAATFIVLGLIAGFVISPGWVCMKLWNCAFAESGIVTVMNIYQGIMLWAIIALSLYALNNKRSLIGFGAYQGLSPEQIKDIMNRARESESKILKDIEAMNKTSYSLPEKEIKNETEQNDSVSDSDKEKVGK